MKNLLLRATSGIVYVALIVCAVLFGTQWFTALMILFASLGIIEFQQIVAGKPANGWQCAARLLDVAAALSSIFVTKLEMLPSWLMILCLSILSLYIICRFTIALYDKAPTAYSSVAWSVLSLVYVALPLCVLNLVYADNTTVMYSVLAMFVMIWLNDTGAYCVGSLIGRHKMFPRLSPKKSWEGFFGGLVFCVGSGYFAYLLIPDSFGLIKWLAFGLMVCVLSTWGDLFESLLKRSHSIKDSGHIIPGHGGILDRIDSLLFVSLGTGIFFMFVV